MKFFSKIELWINKLDSKIFGKDPSYQPCAGVCFKHVLITTLIAGVVLFFVQVFVKGERSQEVVGILTGLGILYYIIKDIRPAIRSFHSIWKKIGYALFNIILSAIALQLAMYVIFLFLIMIVLWIILTFIAPDSKSRYKVEYEDGTSEEIEAERGLLGEKRGRTRDGREVDLDGPNTFS